MGRGVSFYRRIILLREERIRTNRCSAAWYRRAYVNASAQAVAALAALQCPNSSYGTHRCIRCDSEVE